MPEKLNTLDLLTLNLDTCTDEELISLVEKFMVDSETNDKEFREKAITCNNFYHGFQWDAESRAEMNNKRLPYLTFNIIKKVIDFITGTQERNRKDIVVKPVKNAQTSISSVLTKLIKDVVEKNEGLHLLSNLFKTGCIKGRGFIHAYRDYDLDPWTGGLKLELIDALDCLIDTTSKQYSLGDSKFFIIRKWMNKDEIIEQYPKLTEKLMSISQGDDDASKVDDDIFSIDTTSTEGLDATESRYNNRSDYRYRVLWTYVRKAIKRTHLIDSEEMSDYILQTDDAKENAKELETENPERYKVVERVDKVLYLIKTIDDIVLEKVKEPFKDRDNNEEVIRNVSNKFPVIPFGCGFDDGKWSSLLLDLLDPQKEKNKLRSATLHNVCSMANSGYFIPKNSVDEETKQNLETSGARTGIIIEYDAQIGKPEKIQPNQFPQSIFLLGEQSNEDIREISGINTANYGQTTSQESGKLNELRQIQGLTTNTSIFDNFDLSMKLLGELIIEIIRSTNIYTTEEIEQVVEMYEIYDEKTLAEANQYFNSKFPIPPIEEAMQEASTEEGKQNIQLAYNEINVIRQNIVMKFAKEIIKNDISNIYKGKYSVKVSQSPYAPTIREANKLLLFNLSAQYPGIIPVELLLDFTDLPEKDKIINELKQKQAAAAEAEKMKIQQEMMGKLKLEETKQKGAIELERIKQKSKLLEKSMNIND